MVSDKILAGDIFEILAVDLSNFEVSASVKIFQLYDAKL